MKNKPTRNPGRASAAAHPGRGPRGGGKNAPSKTAGKTTGRTTGKNTGSKHSGRRPDQNGAAGRSAQLSPKSPDGYFLFGRHAVEAALLNSARECVRLLGTRKALSGVPDRALRALEAARVPSEVIEDDLVLRSAVPADAPHQGLLLEVRPLPGTDILDLAPIGGQRNILLMLDQVTDPHNVGACLRSAAALGARALITQDRNSPSESGTLARASSGGLETLPWARVANLTQALDTLKEMGYWHVGLDGHTDSSIRDIDMGDNIVIVMGSEGKGLRPLVRKHCDAIAKIPMTGSVESLNVSNAAAIALYELGKL